MKQQTGFSLIELVIVIVVLGILAVTALPRFLDVTEEAKNASVEGVSGGFATGVLLVRARQLRWSGRRDLPVRLERSGPVSSRECGR